MPPRSKSPRGAIAPEDQEALIVLALAQAQALALDLLGLLVLPLALHLAHGPLEELAREGLFELAD